MKLNRFAGRIMPTATIEIAKERHIRSDIKDTPPISTSGDMFDNRGDLGTDKG